jgi:hypothetical protein
MNTEHLSDLVLEMARQVASMAPEDAIPGRDVAFLEHPTNKDALVVKTVNPERNPDGFTYTTITLDPMDTYTLFIIEFKDMSNDGGEANVETIRDVYCTDLGERLFGTKARPWNLPLYSIEDADGNVIAEG